MGQSKPGIQNPRPPQRLSDEDQYEPEYHEGSEECMQHQHRVSGEEVGQG